MKNKNRLKFYLKIIIVAFMFIFLTPLAINIIVTIENPFGLGFINESNKDTWINFFGAIIGGGTTLLGVWWTIKDQGDQRKKDLVIQYRPIVNLKLLEKPKVTNNNFYEMFLERASKNDNFLTIDFQIINANDYACVLNNVYFSQIKCIEGIRMDLLQQNQKSNMKMNLGYPLALYNPYNIRIKIYYPENIDCFTHINRYSFVFGIQFHNSFEKKNNQDMSFKTYFSIIKEMSKDKYELKIKDIEITIEN